MPDLLDHFEALTRVRPPEAWPDLGEREPRLAAPGAGPRRRIAVAALALLVAAAGFVVAIRAFHAGPRSTTLSPPIRNGLIAFSRGGAVAGLYVMNPDGTGVTRLASERGDTGPAWSPDGSRIAFVRFGGAAPGIYVMNADGTGLRRITDGGPGIDGTDVGPAWSPDGTRIAFAREGRPAGADTGNTDIYVANSDGADVVRLTRDPVMEYSPAWSPDGSRIAFVGYDLAAGGRPPSSMRLFVMNADGTGVRALGPENVDRPAWSPDGSDIAFVDTQTGWIMAIHPDGTGLRRVVDAARLVGGVHLVSGATWSPDGTRIAFTAGPDATDTHIYLVDRDGSGVRQLTDGPAPDDSPAWQAVRGTDVSPLPQETSPPSPTPALPTTAPSSTLGGGMFAAMLDAIHAASPQGWRFTLGGDRLDGDWRLDGDAETGSGPGRLYVDVTTRPGNIEADPCADSEFRQGAPCTEHRLADGSLLVLRDVVTGPGHMKTIDVVLVHPDRSGVTAETGNWTIAALPNGTPISQGQLATPRVTRSDPLYTVDQLARLVRAVDEAFRECTRTSCT